MIVLTIRTDKPQAELGLFADVEKLAYISWQAHRELAETIHKKLDEILDWLSISQEEVQGIVVFEGPGSFTGLRIGMSVGNALAYGMGIPIVANGGKNWLKSGIKNLQAGKNERVALPKYGAPATITKTSK